MIKICKEISTNVGFFVVCVRETFQLGAWNKWNTSSRRGCGEALASNLLFTKLTIIRKSTSTKKKKKCRAHDQVLSHNNDPMTRHEQQRRGFNTVMKTFNEMTMIISNKIVTSWRMVKWKWPKLYEFDGW